MASLKGESVLATSPSGEQVPGLATETLVKRGLMKLKLQLKLTSLKSGGPYISRCNKQVLSRCVEPSIQTV